MSVNHVTTLPGVLDSLSRLGLSSVEPQGLSNVVWALGKMDTSGVHGLHQSLDAIMDAVLAKVRVWNDVVFVGRLFDQGVFCSMRSYHTCAWSVFLVQCVLFLVHTPFLLTPTTSQAPQLCPQDISNLLYGLASMGPVRYHPQEAVLEAMAESALRHMKGHSVGKGAFTPQGIGNTLWYATTSAPSQPPRYQHHLDIISAPSRYHLSSTSTPSQHQGVCQAGPQPLARPPGREHDGSVGIPPRRLPQPGARQQPLGRHHPAPSGRPNAPAATHRGTHGRTPAQLPAPAGLGPALLVCLAALRPAVHHVWRCTGRHTQVVVAMVVYRTMYTMSFLSQQFHSTNTKQFFSTSTNTNNSSPPQPTQAILRLHSSLHPPSASIQVLANITLAMGRLQLPTTPSSRDRLAAHATALRPSSAAHQRPAALLHLHHGLALLGALDPAAFLELQTALEPHAGAIADADWQALHLMACVAGVPRPPTPPLEEEEEIWQAGPRRIGTDRIDLDAVWQVGTRVPPAAWRSEQEVGSPDLEPDWGCLWQAGPPARSMQDVLTALSSRPEADDDGGIWQLGPTAAQPDLGLLLLQYAATLPGASRSVHAFDTNPVRYMGPLTSRARESWVAWQRAHPQPACCDAVEDILKLLGLTYVRGYWTEQGIRVDFLVRAAALQVALVCCGRGDHAINDPTLLVCATKILKHRALEVCAWCS